MKKAITLIVLCMTGLILMAGTSWSEEGAWYDGAENWIVRVYTAPSGADYAVSLEVLDTGNVLVTDPIVGMTTNPQQITGSAGGPDVSLAFDEGSATAYVLYTAGGGGAVAMQAMPDIVRARGAMEVLPNPVLFGNVVIGKSSNKTVTLSNTGTLPVNISTIGTPGGPFSIVALGTTCTVGVPVAVGGSCSIVVRLAPLAGTPYSSSFGIITDAGSVTVNLSGTGSYH